jgi:hypothetical protein
LRKERRSGLLMDSAVLRDVVVVVVVAGARKAWPLLMVAKSVAMASFIIR